MKLKDKILPSKIAVQNEGPFNITAVLFLILFLLITVDVYAVAATTKGYPLKIKSYLIQSIPFERYEIPAESNGPAIIFSQYASQAKAVYPASKDKIPANAAEIVKKCQAVLKESLNKIISGQQENSAVKNYLSLNGEIALFKKEDYLRLINTPQEQTIQIESATGNVIAEFRSQEIAINENNSFCLYITFIYGRDRLNKIIISAIKLIKQNY